MNEPISRTTLVSLIVVIFILLGTIGGLLVYIVGLPQTPNLKPAGLPEQLVNSGASPAENNNTNDSGANADATTTPASVSVAWYGQPARVTTADKFKDGQFVKKEGEYDNFELYAVGKITSGGYKDYTLFLQIERSMGTWHSYFIGLEQNNITAPIYAIIPQSVTKQELAPGEIRLAISNLEPPLYIAIPNSPIQLEREDYGFQDLASAYEKTALFNSDGVEVLQSSQYGCPLVVRPDGTVASYRFKLDFIDQAGVLDLTLKSGEKNTDQYDYLAIGGCGDHCTRYSPLDKAINPETDLEEAGVTPQGFKFYQLKNQKHSVLVSMYNEPNSSYKVNEPNLTYDGFLAKHPLFFWQDPLGRWITFQNRQFMPLAEMCKPVVYLYPTTPTVVTVRVEPTGGMSVSEPLYGVDGWRVLAQPNGQLATADGSQYGNLFWEGVSLNYKKPATGFVVQQSAVAVFFDEKLSYLGLNQKEIADFEAYWLPRFRLYPYYLITFLDQAVFERIAPLSVEPKPDTVIRVFMDYQGLREPIIVDEPKLTPKNRQGFSVIEWGGAARN